MLITGNTYWYNKPYINFPGYTGNTLTGARE